MLNALIILRDRRGTTRAMSLAAGRALSWRLVRRRTKVHGTGRRVLTFASSGRTVSLVRLSLLALLRSLCTRSISLGLLFVPGRDDIVRKSISLEEKCFT